MKFYCKVWSRESIGVLLLIMLVVYVSIKLVKLAVKAEKYRLTAK